MFKVSHPDDRTIHTPSDSNTALFSCAATRYHTNPERLKGNFPEHIVFKTSAQYVGCAPNVFLGDKQFSATPFDFSLLDEFLYYEVPHSKLFVANIMIQTMFLNRICLSHRDWTKRMELFMYVNLICQINKVPHVCRTP